MNLETFIIRITICFILSIAIGLERQIRHKVVGLRTNVLVCLGAFMFVSLSFNVSNTDSSRIAAQVVSGIGFLGAGVILRDGNRIKGLNTAATLWCVAAIGVLTASGMLIEATIGTLFILLSNIILRIFSQKIMNKIKNQQNCILNITCNEDEETILKTLIIKLTNKYNININSFEKKIISKDEINLKVNIVSNEKIYFDKIIKMITTEANINYINIEQNKLIDSDNEDSDE